MGFVEETFEFDHGRQVTAYVPERSAELIVYCGDGQLIPRWGSDLATADLPPTMIVGVHCHADEILRLQEYSPGFDPVRFEQHEAFFVGELRSWVKSRLGVELPCERTAVFGVSASGELALAMGARHPGIFGAVLSASPGAGYRPAGREIRSMPPTYLVAGRQEPFFLENALRWVDALQEDGGAVVMEKRDSGHDDAMWRAELPKMIKWVCARLK